MSTVTKRSALEARCVDTIRLLAVDAVQKARSGHPGMPMGAATIAHTLFTRHLSFDAADPSWPDRDRFVLSAGHGSMLLYAMLHLCGYDVSLDDIQDFRQWGSRTPGHPEFGQTPGVETTTGPLGQGFGNAVGMATAERFLAAIFNGEGPDIVDHFTYVLAGDGDMMEGVSSEAASIAGHQHLGKLIVLYDDNHVTIDGPTDVTFTEDVCKRFEAYGWHVQRVAEGDNVEAIDTAIEVAKAEAARPSLIAVRTHIGCGSPNKQDTSGVHGAPLGEEEIRLTKEACDWPLEPRFHIPDDVRAFYAEVTGRNAAKRAAWDRRYAIWRNVDEVRRQIWDQAWSHELPEGWDADLPVFEQGGGDMAGRIASGKALNAVAGHLPTLFGGSADLAVTNMSWMEGLPAQQADAPEGRNYYFGVREHAMAAMANGMAVHGGIRPYVATFFAFTDYLKPSLRLSAIMKQPVIYILTHDSLGDGEDGPTHQPIEQLAMLRAMPNCIEIRPADANEVVEGWRVALEHSGGPIVLVLTRQELPLIDRSIYASASGIARGAYVVADAADGSLPDVLLIASGSEVHSALAAHQRLMAEGIRSRVVNLASWHLFDRQDQAYRDEVLPPQSRCRLGVECAASLGWERWVGDAGEIIALDRFGASAPATVLFDRFGFSAENVYQRAKALLSTSFDSALR